MTTAQINTINRNKSAQLNFIYVDTTNHQYPIYYIGLQDGTLTRLLSYNSSSSSSGSGSLSGIGLPNSQIFVGNASNLAQAVPLSGDATIVPSGVLTLANTGVVAGTYGDQLNVATTTVDSKGRVTAIANTPIDLIISKTHAEITTLISTSGLQESCLYFISDKNVYLTATSSSTLSTTGILKATNADYNNVTTNFIGVWEGTILVEYNNLVGSFQIGELVNCSGGGQLEVLRKVAININNTRYFQCISTNGTLPVAAETMTGVTSGSTGTIISVTSTAISGSIAANKIMSWNNLHYVNTTGSATIQHPKYDTTNWTALATTDSSYQIEYDRITYNFTSDLITTREDKRGNVVMDKEGISTLRFQWGRNTVFGNNIYSFDFTGWNAVTAQTNLFIQDSGFYISDKANFSFTLVLSRSTFNAFRDSDGLASDVTHSNLTMYDGNCRHIGLHNFGDVTVVDSTGSISDTEVRGATLMLIGNSDINFCNIDGGTPSLQKIFTNESHSNKSYKRDVFSTFETAISQAFGLTTLTLDSDLYGVYNTTITGGVAAIDTIANMPTYMSVQILAKGANNIGFVNGATLMLKGGVNQTLIPGNEDWIELQNLNGTTKEINIGQY